MTNEEAKAIIQKEYLCVDRDCDIERSCGKCDLMMPSKEPILQAYKIAMQVLSQESCNDAISRQAAIDIIESWLSCDAYNEAERHIMKAMLCALKDLQPIKPQLNMGHWEWVQYGSNPNIGNWHCSECRMTIPHMPEEIDNTPIYKWCPYCGAKMVESQERLHSVKSNASS